ncbi:MAG: WYL domain-containing protein [Bacteroidales bacterium]|nr:WYL domain-containing protein [Bacteroidales bacterium]
MPVNKNALLRLKTIDSLLSDRKGHSISEIISECSLALQKSGHSDSVSKVTIYSDIKTLEKEWGVKIEKSSTYPVMYSYAYDSVTMSGDKLSYNGYSDLQFAVAALEGASGILQVDKTTEKVRKRLDEISSEKKIIDFSSNKGLKGLDLLWPIYQYIRDDKPLYIIYKEGYENEIQHDFQPYYLKQYNNRWFLLGWSYNEGIEDMRTLALDRIEDIRVNRSRMMMPDKIRKNEINFEEYFDDIIGVTKKENEEVKEIVLRADLSFPPGKKDFNRILTKPLHHSQRCEEKDGFGYITIEVRRNVELFTNLRQFEHIEIVSPEDVREEHLRRIRSILYNYGLKMVKYTGPQKNNK